jgi:hypothetical protein
MNPLTQLKKTTILPLLITLALVMSGCSTFPSLQLATVPPFSPVVVADSAGDFRFNIVVKNFDTADSPLAFLEVKTTYSLLAYGANACKSPSKYVQIPALKPNKTWSYNSRIEDLGVPNSPYVKSCACKKNSCWGNIRFTLHKANYAQMTGPNISWSLNWDWSGDIAKQKVVDLSQ